MDCRKHKTPHTLSRFSHSPRLPNRPNLPTRPDKLTVFHTPSTTSPPPSFITAGRRMKVYFDYPLLSAARRHKSSNFYRKILMTRYKNFSTISKALACDYCLENRNSTAVRQATSAEGGGCSDIAAPQQGDHTGVVNHSEQSYKVTTYYISSRRAGKNDAIYI